jgi:hypothetical protein
MSQRGSPPRLLTVRGKTMPLYQWAKAQKIGEQTIRARLRYGWPVEKAVLTPARRYGKGA